jgi:hypothetical protein
VPEITSMAVQTYRIQCLTPAHRKEVSRLKRLHCFFALCFRNLVENKEDRKEFSLETTQLKDLI